MPECGLRQPRWLRRSQAGAPLQSCTQLVARGAPQPAQPCKELLGHATSHGKCQQQVEHMPVPRSACLFVQTADDGLVVKKTLEDTEEWKKPNAGEHMFVCINSTSVY